MKRRKSTGAPFLSIVGAIIVLLSCGTTHYVPIETGTTVHVKDSTVFNYIDSVRITEATRYKDLAWLGDTLRIDGQRSHMYAYADTVKEAIIGGLQEDKVEERVKIIFKDKIEYRDSVRIEQIPIPVEVEKKVVPKFWRVTGVIGIVLSILILVYIGLKIYLKFQKPI